MATLRTVIEGTANGQVKIERQARVGILGNAAQRKKQATAGVQETWRTVDRVIAQSTSKLPGKAADWPFTENLIDSSPEVSDIALFNAGTARNYALQAEETVSRINIAAHNFGIATPRRVRVVLEEY